MTWPHTEPAEIDPRTLWEGRGCGGCHYLGWGPGLAARCCHPERACWVRLTWWALGCEQREPLDKVYRDDAPPPYPRRVDLGAWCEALHQRRLLARRPS